MVHQYKLNGYNIVIDVNSGSIHLVDDVAYDVIQIFCAEIEKIESSHGMENAELDFKNEMHIEKSDGGIGSPNEVSHINGLSQREVSDIRSRVFDLAIKKLLNRSNSQEGVTIKDTDEAFKEISIAKPITSDELSEYEGRCVTNSDSATNEIKDIALNSDEKCDEIKNIPTDEELNQLIDDLFALYDAGKLCSHDLYDEPLFIQRNGIKKDGHVVKALCLHVAHACDLTCSYCFAGQGKFKGESALMSAETAKRAIDFLIANSGDRRNLEVDFFGGEPLLNFDVVKETVAYAREIEKQNGKNFRFTLTTNGTGLTDEIIDFANREMHNVVLSLDGRKEIHDRERKTHDGKGSYDVSVPNFQKLVKKRGNKNYYIRGTFTHYNPDFLKDIEHMLSLGFSELSMEPVVCDKDSRFHLNEQDLSVVLTEYEKLAELMLRRYKEGKKFTFYHYMLDLKGGPCIYKRISGCGSGSEYFAVTPTGELYPCHQFVGDKKYLMGNIYDGIENSDLREDFERCNIYSKEECRECWARLYCSGGCVANAYHDSGDINGIYEDGCTLFKKRIECAIMYQIAKENKGM